MTFELLNIKTEIVKALKEDGLVKPTQIQKLTIPLIKSGNDVIGMSKTGSGKTVAFGVPLLEKIQPKKGIQVLIMAPTRELVVQIAKELRKFSKYLHVKIATVYGGVAINPQIEKLSRSEVVVGTTGRLCDHLQRRTLNLSKINTIVLDEADKMVDMGFIEDIERILSQVPKKKQVLLFGATISQEINNIKRKHMNNPKTTKADSYVKDEFLEQFYYDILPNEKFSLLVHLLHNEKSKKAIIFCPTIVGVEILTRNLKMQGVRVEMIHGKLKQATRQKIIDNFNKGQLKFLVASPVAARGLDIRNVSHVYNYGLSTDPQEYIHRIGRTARAGESGKAITLLESRDHDAFRQILHNYKLNVKKLEKPQFKRLRFQAKRFSQGNQRKGFPSRGPRGFGRQNNRSTYRSRRSRYSYSKA